MLVKLAFRNLFRNRRRSLLTGLTMTCGFVLMAVSIGLTEGSYGELIDAFTGQFTGHAQVSHPEWAQQRSLYKTIPPDTITAIAANPAVRAVAPRIHGDSLVFYKNSTFGGQVVGIDPTLEQNATSIGLRLAKGRSLSDPGAYEAVVGGAIAKVLGIELGGEIVLISQGADGSIANDLFRVVGIIGTDQESRDDYRIYLPIEAAGEFFSLYGRIHELAVMLHDLGDTEDFVAAQTKTQAASGPAIVTRLWQDVETDFYRTMQIDKKGNTFSFVLLMVIIGVGILNSILMTTLERTREFGVLKALGTMPRQIFGMIVVESVALALMAIAAAIVIAYFAITVLSHHGIRFDEALKVAGMVIEEHRARLVVEAFVIPSATVLATTLIASLYPAYRAAKQSVAACLRDF